MKPVKYIFLSSTTNGKNLKYYKLDDDNFFVGSWAGLIARRLKSFKPDLNISIWRLEPVVQKPFKKCVYNLDGIIWPNKRLLIRNILSFGMYFEILKLSLRYKIFLHYHSIFDRFIILRFLLPPNVKIVLSHHGGVPPSSGRMKDFLFKLTYKYASAITYLTPFTKEYLKSIGVSNNRMHFLPVGADFSQFIPGDKKLIRKRLGLNEDMIYGIYVGKLYRLKSVDLILEVYNKLKSHYKFSIIFVGGSDTPENDLYDEVINSGCPWFGIVPWSEMVNYFNASDFYIHPAFNPAFGGLDVSWMEAIACNKPVISPQLGYLDFNYSELGVIIQSKSEMLEKTKWMIENYHSFKNCRKVAQKHLDGKNAIIRKLVKVYESV